MAVPLEDDSETGYTSLCTYDIFWDYRLSILVFLDTYAISKRTTEK